MAIPTCPVGCASSLGTASFDPCAPETNFGEIRQVYLAAADTPFADWTSAAEWAARIDNTGVAIDYVLCLTVRGEKPAPDVSTIRIAGGTKVNPPKTHTLNFKIDETNQTNYEFLRQTECNGKFIMYYADESYLYGGQDGTEGIEVNILMSHILPESFEEIQTFEGVIEWEAEFHPSRIDNPIA